MVNDQTREFRGSDIVFVPHAKRTPPLLGRPLARVPFFDAGTVGPLTVIGRRPWAVLFDPGRIVLGLLFTIAVTPFFRSGTKRLWVSLTAPPNLSAHLIRIGGSPRLEFGTFASLAVTLPLKAVFADHCGASA